MSLIAVSSGFRFSPFDRAPRPRIQRCTRRGDKTKKFLDREKTLWRGLLITDPLTRNATDLTVGAFTVTVGPRFRFTFDGAGCRLGTDSNRPRGHRRASLGRLRSVTFLR